MFCPVTSVAAGVGDLATLLGQVPWKGSPRVGWLGAAIVAVARVVRVRRIRE